MQTDPDEQINLVNSQAHLSVKTDFRARLLTKIQAIEGFTADVIDVESTAWTQRTIDDCPG